MNSVNSNISFYSEAIDFNYSDTEKAITWLEHIARKHDVIIGEINYIFCSDDYLLELNKEHLDHDYYTDILTFPFQSSPIVSDIFISIDRVKDNASSLGIVFEDELHRVMVHGLLHLLGYDDHSDEDVAKMRKAEENALSELQK